jgi:hypothetical protein
MKNLSTKKAVVLAQSDAAKNLPGFTGKPAATPQQTPVAAKAVSKKALKSKSAAKKIVL